MSSSDTTFQVEVVPAPRPGLPPQIVVYKVDTSNPIHVSQRVYAEPNDETYQSYQALHKASHDACGAPPVVSELELITGYSDLESALRREIGRATGTSGDTLDLTARQIVLVIRDDLTDRPSPYL